MKPVVTVHHSCPASNILYNVTLKMGLHSGEFEKIGRVDSMDDCIELCCKADRSDVAFMLGRICYSVKCYSKELCKTVPVLSSNINDFNLNPAVAYLGMRFNTPVGTGRLTPSLLMSFLLCYDNHHYYHHQHLHHLSLASIFICIVWVVVFKYHHCDQRSCLTVIIITKASL